MATTGQFTSWVHSEAMFAQGNLLSEAFAFSSFWGHFVIIGLTALVMATRSRRWGCWLAAIMITVVLAAAVKRVVREPRPDAPWAHHERMGHGMPSQHSATGMAAAVWFVFNIAPRPGSKKAALAILLAVFQAYGRVYNGYHTYSQVVAGCALGAAVAYLLAWSKVGQRLVVVGADFFIGLASIYDYI